MEEIYAIETLNQCINKIYPLDVSFIKSEQDQYPKFTQLKEKHPEKCKVITQDYIEVETYNGFIFVLASMQKRIIDWYHKTLSHAGIMRFLKIIGQDFTFSDIKEQIEDFILSCNAYHRTKL